MPSLKPCLPRFSESDAVKIVKDLFGLVCQARLLNSYSDQNFYMKDAAGAEFIFKVANSAETPLALDFQNQAMTFLNERKLSLKFPAVKSTKSGKQITAIKDQNGNRFLLRMLTFLPGKMMMNCRPYTAGLLKHLGHGLGEMDLALQQFAHAGANRDLSWDLRNALQVLPKTRYVEDPARRRMVEYFLLQYELFAYPVLPDLPKSIIHNDANDWNLLAAKNKAGQHEVAGLIDFGDMLHTNTIGELAISCAYMLMEREDPLAAAVQMVAGYHQGRPLLEAELSVLFHLICARLSCSVTMSAFGLKENPGNTYLTVSEKPAWALLEKLLLINPDKAEERFRAACGFETDTQPVKIPNQEIVDFRQQHLGKSLSISYKQPLKMVRGVMQYLIEEDGRAYLDCVNNVCHVGHCHPQVVRALQKQASILNTNTRYLHENIINFSKRLIATMPPPLSVCFFVNSGSEANELAIRLAGTHTGKTDCIVLDHAYHGNTNAVIDLSPYKFDSSGGRGAPKHIHKVAMPDVFRGYFRGDDRDAAFKYGKLVQKAVFDIERKGRGVSAFFAESLPGCGGQIVFPDGYLKAAYENVREAGGVCVADEVQVGFGRVGSHFWGFETQGVVPDIVTLGKPIGNGHPLGAVVTTPEIAESFHNGMEYFNTFGGNPVSCAVGLAVLDVIENESLQQNALVVGNHFKQGLQKLQARYPLIGDVRGLGLYLGIELVQDAETLAPAAEAASEIVERMKENGILLSTDGPLHNVIKIKPPIVFSKENADLVVSTLDKVFAEM